MKFRHNLLAIVLNAIYCSLAAGQGTVSTVQLEQVHIQLDPATTNAVDFVVYKSIDNDIVPSYQVNTQIVYRVESLCSMVLPGLSISQSPATNILGWIADMPYMTAQSGSIGSGGILIQSTNDLPSSQWTFALPVENVVIRSDIFQRVYYVEIIDRLAQILNLRVGVLNTGHIVFGTDGNWPTNHIPAYLLELSVQYSE